MQELCRTNDAVKLSYIEALLSGASIAFTIADAHVSAVEGYMAPFPRRVFVGHADWQRAIDLLEDAGVDR